jgi:hypothetical protein
VKTDLRAHNSDTEDSADELQRSVYDLGNDDFNMKIST